MTTNVLDRRNARIASDSRWSVDSVNFVYFVDDTGFDKIAERSSAVMICAGNSGLIDQWKTWFCSPNPSYVAPPSQLIDLMGTVVAEIAVTILTKPGFQVEFSRGSYEHFEDHAYFCGTGGVPARDCYSVNGCSFKCVETAKNHDPCTGGEVKYYELHSFNNNLSSPKATLDQMLHQLVDRGFAMNKSTREITPMDPLTQEEFRKQLANGTLSVSAPTGSPLRAWTERERHDVQEAMRRIVERETPANG